MVSAFIHSIFFFMNKNNELHNCLLSNLSSVITMHLDDSYNYITWSFLLENKLVGYDLMRYIDGSLSCLHVLPSEYATIKIIIMIKRSPVSMQALSLFSWLLKMRLNNLRSQFLWLPRLQWLYMVMLPDFQRWCRWWFWLYSWGCYIASAFTSGLHNPSAPNFWFIGFLKFFYSKRNTQR